MMWKWPNKLPSDWTVGFEYSGGCLFPVFAKNIPVAGPPINDILITSSYGKVLIQLSVTSTDSEGATYQAIDKVVEYFKTEEGAKRLNESLAQAEVNAKQEELHKPATKGDVERLLERIEKIEVMMRQT